MKKYLLCVLLILAIVFFCGCHTFLLATNLKGEGAILPQEYSLDGGTYSLVVTDIQLDNIHAGVITIDENLADAVVLNTQENIARTISITVDEFERKIKIKGNKNYRYQTDNFTLEIGVPIKDARIDNAFALDAKLPSITEFSLKINGSISGDFAFDLLDSLDFQVDGAASLSFSGQCGNCSAVLNGASEVDGSALATLDAKITINGTGDYIVNVRDTLEANINGAGNIKYMGNPAITECINGLGTITQK